MGKKPLTMAHHSRPGTTNEVTASSLIRRLRKVLIGLRASGLIWQEVADHFGGDRAQAYMIATGKWIPKEKTLSAIMEKMPQHLFWRGPRELDKEVLRFLTEYDRLTGKELAKRCGTTGRTIRKSIRRLRSKEHKIGASMSPPRGYRLNQAHTLQGDG